MSILKSPRQRRMVRKHPALVSSARREIVAMDARRIQTLNGYGIGGLVAPHGWEPAPLETQDLVRAAAHGRFLAPPDVIRREIACLAGWNRT